MDLRLLTRDRKALREDLTKDPLPLSPRQNRFRVEKEASRYEADTGSRTRMEVDFDSDRMSRNQNCGLNGTLSF